MEKVKLNIVPKGKKSTCYASQNDNGRVVRFELFNELIPYILDGSETISIKVVRPDSEEILASIENTFEGKDYIDVVFNTNMTEIAGVGECEITITDGETVLGSRNFDMNIEIDAYNGRDVIIETSTGTLAEFDTEVEDNALEYESSIPYNAAGYTGLRVINTRTAPAYDKTPYLFRKTPSGYGNSCIEKLNGLSVAFNQLLNKDNYSSTTTVNDVVYTNNGDGSITVNGTASAISTFIFQFYAFELIQGHKYFIGGHYVGVDGSNGGSYSQINAPMFNCLYSGTANYCYIRIPEGVTINETIYPQIIDLTQMFGSTIADYIYSLETAQAGAGLSFFKALFGADYYPFNAGELMSVKTSGRKTVGKNLFNKNQSDTTVGFLDNAGNITYSETWKTSDYLPILSGKYTFSGVDIALGGYYGVCWYDSNKNLISGFSSFTVDPITVTIPDNAKYIRYSWSIYSSDTFMLNFGEEALNYEPYIENIYSLDPDLELRGIPKLDANNKLYGDGDIYESSGDVTRRYGLLNLGSVNWTYQDGIFQTKDESFAGVTGATIGNYLSARYSASNAWKIYGSDDDKIFYVSTDHYIRIKDSAYNDKDQFKAAVNGIYMICELVTPTSESADPFTDPQEARITEEFIDDRAIPIPVGQDTIYGTDIEYQDIDFDTTIYGGEIDAVNGVLSSEYNSDGSVKPTPEIIDITPTPIPVKAGDNKIFNNANGNQTIRYYNQVEE